MARTPKKIVHAARALTPKSSSERALAAAAMMISSNVAQPRHCRTLSAVGIVGFQVHLALALGGGLVVYWGARLVGAVAGTRLRTA